jgi:methionyl-tRNA synthetase
MESFIQRYNSDLANDFGNLLSRVTTLIKKNYDNVIPSPGELSDMDIVIKNKGEILPDKINELINGMRLNDAIEEVMQFIRTVNKYMEDNAPWKMVKEDKVAAGKVLYIAGESLRLGAVLLSPIMPKRTGTLLEALNVKGCDLSWGRLEPGKLLKGHEPLFPRIK